MPDQALELSFDPASAAAVVAQWEALKAAGIPSQADHRSMTNAPHLTLVAAVAIDLAAVSVARDAVRPLLPARVGVRGLVVFGQGARVTIAHLVEPDSSLAAATARRCSSISSSSMEPPVRSAGSVRPSLDLESRDSN